MNPMPRPPDSGGPGRAAGRRIRRRVRWLGVAVLAAGLSVPASAVLIRRAADGRVYDDVTAVPARRVALVLGCARTLGNGRTNLFFRHRVRAAAGLYHAGRAEFIIVSGDNHRAGYDEPGDMKQDLVALGVPAERIYCDYAGFRTLDSVVRARTVFGQTQITVVSQAFHNERALFIARHHGVDAIGFNAPGVGRRYSFTTLCREQFARVKTVLDVFVLRTPPKFGGPPVTIGLQTPQAGDNHEARTMKPLPMSFLRTALAAAGLVWAAVPAAAAEPAPAGDTSAAAEPDALPARIARLIRDLGDAKFAVRRQAAAELRTIGYPAAAALREAAQSDDPEVATSARALYKEARWGITPAWPADLAQAVLHFDEDGAERRAALIARVAETVKADALPFLLSCLEADHEAEAQAVVEALARSGDDAMAEGLAAQLREPRTDGQARAAAWAHLRRKQPLEALKALTVVRGENPQRPEAVELAVQELVGKVRAKELEPLAAQAEALARLVPDEARFLYLQAIALGQLRKTEEANALAARALKLHPDQEGPHFTAGEMLGDLGLGLLACREWEALLAIPPEGEVYDINAHLRLGQLAERNRRYGAAAAHLEKALTLFRGKRAGGGGYGMVGTNEAELAQKIAALRARGDAAEAPADGPSLALQITMKVKDGRDRELETARREAHATLSVNVQPAGFRLLDLKECRLVYRRDTEEIAVLLHDAPAGKAHPCPLGTKPARLLVTSLDCVYLFDVDPVAATVTPAGRFEYDYEIRITADERLRSLKGREIKIGEQTVTWDELQAGVKVDFLPPFLEIHLEGPGANGEVEKKEFKIPTDRAAADQGRPAPAPAAPPPETPGS